MAKERPILFSGEMVKAILDGRKTQTRRVVDLRPEAVLSKAQRKIGFTCSPEHAVAGDLSWVAVIGGVPDSVKELQREQQINVPIRHPEDKEPWEDCPRQRIYCPHGQVGDRLWVKETFFPVKSCKGPASYRATWPKDDEPPDEGWRPSIYMPRWASRITLEIAEVRVQRVQEISEDDAKAEGIDLTPVAPDHKPNATRIFSMLWDSINEHRGFGWPNNPWVWAITFKRV